MTSPGLLADLERYYDTAPRAACDTEELGPLTLFLPRGGFPYYARPRLDLAGEVTAADVRAVLDRQRELDVPRAVEWVHDTTPSLLAAARYPDRVLGMPSASLAIWLMAAGLLWQAVFIIGGVVGWGGFFLFQKQADLRDRALPSSSIAKQSWPTS